MKPLIILGSGASLKTVDFNLLTNQDTFGLNNCYIKFQEMNWFPKYYGIFTLIGSRINQDDITKFIDDNYLKFDKIFFNSEKFKDLFPNNLSRIQHVNIQPVKHLTLDLNLGKYSVPLSMDISLAHDLLTDKSEKDKFSIFLDFMTKEEKEEFIKLNKFGMIKKYRNEPLEEADYITNPRFQLRWYYPKSFDDFIFNGYTSPIIATWIGHLLGYKKIILLGVDCRWQIIDNIIDTKNTYWFEGYFKEPYNINDYCSKCTGEILQNESIKSWINVKETIEAYDLDLEVVNCSQGSAMQVFRQSTLEQEL